MEVYACVVWCGVGGVCGVWACVCVVCVAGVRRESVGGGGGVGEKVRGKGREEVGREGRRRDTDGRTATRTYLMPSELRHGWSENLQ